MAPTASRNTSIVALMAVFSLAIASSSLARSRWSTRARSADHRQDRQPDASRCSSRARSCSSSSARWSTSSGYKPLAIAGFLVLALSMILIARASTFQTAFLACILLGVGRDVPEHRRQHAHPGRAVRRQGSRRAPATSATPSSAWAWSSRRCCSRCSWTGSRGLVPAGRPASSSAAGRARHRRSRGCPPATSSRWRSRCSATARCSSPRLALFCYISLESSMNTWSKPYMTETAGRREQRVGGPAGWVRAEPVRRRDDGRPLPDLDGQEPDGDRREAHRRARRWWRSAPSC